MALSKVAKKNTKEKVKTTKSVGSKKTTAAREEGPKAKKANGNATKGKAAKGKGAAKKKVVTGGKTTIKKKAKKTANKETGKPKSKTRSEVPEHLDPSDARRHFKPGQKNLTAPIGEATRAFYESLYQENPNSLMALKYCIESGVLYGTQYTEAYPRYLAFKSLGAFKGEQGGVKPQFCNGLSDVAIKKALKN